MPHQLLQNRLEMGTERRHPIRRTDRRGSGDGAAAAGPGRAAPCASPRSTATGGGGRERSDRKQAQDPAQAPAERSDRKPRPPENLKWIHVLDAVLRKELADGGRFLLLEAEPPGRRRGVAGMEFLLFEGDQGNRRFRRPPVAAPQAEVIPDFSADDGGLPAGAGQKRLAGSVGPDNSPLLVAGEGPVRVAEHQAIA